MTGGTVHGHLTTICVNVRDRNFIEIFVSTESGLILTTIVHPLCLPFESNEDPNKWKNFEVEVLGFATQDFSYTKGDRMKVAKMRVFTQNECNIEREIELTRIKNCKFLTV